MAELAPARAEYAKPACLHASHAASQSLSAKARVSHYGRLFPAAHNHVNSVYRRRPSRAGPYRHLHSGHRRRTQKHSAPGPYRALCKSVSCPSPSAQAPFAQRGRTPSQRLAICTFVKIQGHQCQTAGCACHPCANYPHLWGEPCRPAQAHHSDPNRPQSKRLMLKSLPDPEK